MAIEISEAGPCTVITLNRPDALNALNSAMLDELDAALDRLRSSASRALIVTGAGDRAFCAGADVRELVGRTLESSWAGTERGQAVFQKLDDLPMPSIALVNGYALGGGLELALACTFRLAVPSAKVGLPEIKLGIIPGYGGTQRLSRLVGQGWALDLILTGRTVGAEEALRLGLVHRIVDGEPLAAAQRFAEEFTGYSRLAVRLARLAIRRAGETSLQEGLRSEAELTTLAFMTEDAAEGFRAFLEKRPPRFVGR
ncbi:MAG: enoyl-CoA hydratase-related protein [Dehalococcoidia bacterium]